ncbi:MAG TPA: PAS domain S-box protein [Herpetosiphonaceae bacterium]|nr:PAS domain S-box protein [Herpetosiphonaceae bacterium]
MQEDDQTLAELARLRPVLETALDAVVVMRSDGTVADWNNTAEEIFGWSRDEALDRLMADLIVPTQYREAHLKGIARYNSTGSANVLNQRLEITALRRDGNEFPVELSITTNSGPGQPLFIGFLRDISKRRHSEALLARQAREAELLFQISRFAAEADSVEEVIQRTLDIICELTGWPIGHALVVKPGEGARLASSDIWHDSGDPRFTALRDATKKITFEPGVGLPGKILSSAEPAWVVDTETDPDFVRKGSGFASAFGFPINSPNGVLAVLEFFTHEKTLPDEELLLTVRTVGEQVGRSIERHAALKELRFLNETLERRVAERTADLESAHEQLRQAQKMEAVGQLTGGIAHDFNNLLTGVIGSLDMMQRRLAKGETDRIERYATTAMTSANRAAALTHRLLAFSRRQPLDPKPVNANRLITGMEELLRRTIGESVRLEIVTAGGLWQTLCDPHQLESAVLNLAINARDAMPEGGKLTIETCNAHLDEAYAAKSREVRPGQYVCICVTDTGTGMTKETIEKAFEPFFTTKPIGQGTGLGLSMIYGFARQSEGYAKIYSEVDHGTTVKLYLPRYYGEGEDAEEASARLSEDQHAESGEVVLVVEDETAVRDLVVDVLQELGYRAIEASDGPSGLKLLQSDVRVDLLVTDVGLPGLNGRQLADAARHHRPDLKVLFMTGYAENATLANGFLDPGMQMITKPFAIEALATRIRDIIQDKDLT